MDRRMYAFAGIFALTVALVLAGCPTDPTSDDDDDTYDDPERVDEDEDGYTPDEGDCDDHDADVNPEADEVCDGADNDCDGDTDEGFDGDGDGYTVCGADGVAGTADDDCDDGDPEVHPGAEEVCDGVDNDCDGQTDGVDADGDGYVAAACDGEDCDDGDPDVHPGAEEVHGNGVDDDCDGGIDVLWDHGSTLDDLVALHTDGTDLHFGTPQSARDIDGDGIYDLYIGAIDTEEPKQPVTWLFAGRSQWPAVVDQTLADGDIDGPEGLGRFGCNAVGDPDGDGYDDLICEVDDALCLYPGSPTFWSPGTTYQDYAACFSPDPAYTGWSLHAARRGGDLDGDGIDDLLITFGDAVLRDGERFERSRQIHIFFGRASWTDLQVTESDADLDIGEPDRMLSRLNIRDLDDDGATDLLIGMGSETPGIPTVNHLIYGDGALWTPGLDLSIADATFEGTLTDGSGLFENVRGAGDIDGDGHLDLHFEAVDEGDRFLMGSADRWSGAHSMDVWDVEFTVPDFWERQAYAHFLEFNGDGIGDVVVGLSSELNHDGVAHVLLGRGELSGSAPWTTAPIRFTGPGQVLYGGSMALPVGDVSGDGSSDLVLGSHRGWNGQAERWWYLAPGYNGSDPGATDDDGDGYTERQGDCDDGDPARHPGASEPPDLTDHDCDGSVFDPGVTRMLLSGSVQASGGVLSGTLEVTYADADSVAICTHEMSTGGTTTSGDHTAQCPACAEEWDVVLSDAGHDCAFDPGQIIALQKFGDWLASLWLADEVPYGYCPGDDCDAMDFDALLDGWLDAGDPTLWIWGPDLVHADLPEFIGYLEPQPGASPTLPADGDYSLSGVWSWW